MLTPEIRINTSTFRREGFSKQGIKNMSRRYFKNMMLFLLLGVVCTTVYIVTLNKEQPVSGGSKQKVHNMKIQDDLLENDDHENKNELARPLDNIEDDEVDEENDNNHNGHNKEDPENEIERVDEDYNEVKDPEVLKDNMDEYSDQDGNGNNADEEENKEFRNQDVQIEDKDLRGDRKNIILPQFLITNDEGEVIDEKLFADGIDDPELQNLNMPKEDTNRKKILRDKDRLPVLPKPIIKNNPVLKRGNFDPANDRRQLQLPQKGIGAVPERGVQLGPNNQIVNRHNPNNNQIVNRHNPNNNQIQLGKNDPGEANRNLRKEQDFQRAPFDPVAANPFLLHNNQQGRIGPDKFLNNRLQKDINPGDRSNLNPFLRAANKPPENITPAVNRAPQNIHPVVRADMNALHNLKQLLTLEEEPQNLNPIIQADINALQNLKQLLPLEEEQQNLKQLLPLEEEQQNLHPFTPVNNEPQPAAQQQKKEQELEEAEIRRPPRRSLHIRDLSVPISLQAKCLNFKFPAGENPLCIHRGDNDADVSQRIEATGFYEPEIMHQMNEILASDATLGFTDIGAGLGVFTIAAAHMKRRVLAVEPLPANYELLHKNALENGVSNMIVLVTEALGNSDSVGVMHFTKDKADYSDVRILTLTLAQKLGIAFNHTNIVQVTTLNKMTDAAPFKRTLMKVDIDPKKLGNIWDSSLGFFRAIEVPYIITHWSVSKYIHSYSLMLQKLKGLGYKPKLTWNGEDATIEDLNFDHSFLVWTKT